MRKKKEAALKLPCKRIAWLHGFVNGRTGSAALNSEQVVESGYIQLIQKRYEAYTTGKFIAWDKQRHALVAEAEKILMELKQPQQKLEEVESLPKNANVIEQRSVARKRKAVMDAKENQKARKKILLDKLVEIRAQLNEGEIELQEHFLQVAAEASALVARYCKGVLWRKPLTEANVPKIHLMEKAISVHEEIELLNQCMQQIGEEVRGNA